MASCLSRMYRTTIHRTLALCKDRTAWNTFQQSASLPKHPPVHKYSQSESACLIRWANVRWYTTAYVFNLVLYPMSLFILPLYKTKFWFSIWYVPDYIFSLVFYPMSLVLLPLFKKYVWFRIWNFSWSEVKFLQPKWYKYSIPDQSLKYFYSVKYINKYRNRKKPFSNSVVFVLFKYPFSFLWCSF